ncbi:hypothetical protein [Salipaludibacillus daqingensis]|uniref:hypothetical protein n=1 Tax=Salipaludibacillus daqingensis TaxID=3041001 RepID=UPI0024770046|nr:hypothetical protein [Salipaludibacillus daqingensis]
MYIQNPANLLKKQRDLTLMAVNDMQYIAIACDSDGGIGSKAQDVVKVSEEIIAQFATRVPLFEIISCGAKPFMVIDCLTVEMDSVGDKILSEIKRYVREVGIFEDVQFTGSSEENVPTVQTGIGVTILGLVDQKDFSIGKSLSGDKVVCIGVPKSGPQYEIHPNDKEIVSLGDLIKLRGYPNVRDILPVGSQGISYEADQFAQSASLNLQLNPSCGIDFNQSAGPSTCVLLSVNEKHIQEIMKLVRAPVTTIGELI